MRVLIANKHAYHMGGADTHCMLLTDGLRERGHEVLWLSTQADVNEEHDGAFVPTRRGAAGVRCALWNRSAAGAMSAAIASFDPEIVHAHMLYPHLSVSPLVSARRAGVPVVHTLHTYELLSAHYASESGGWIDRDSAGFPERVRNTATLPIRRLIHPRFVDEYIAVSAYIADIHARRGISAHVVPNAVATTTANGSELPGFEQRDGILFVGRLVAEKGVLDVVDVARRLPDITVTIAGAGPLWPNVTRAADELPNLSCLGWVAAPELPKHLGAARVLVMPSRWAETSGLAALEALACGTPVVALPRGGLGELVRESNAGLLPSAPGRELAAACGDLHGDRPRWEELSQRGLDAVAGPFSIATWLDRIEAVYARALSGGGRAARRARTAAGH
jgi:glycosyltransferase involved in cell wall biosynthesis